MDREPLLDCRFQILSYEQYLIDLKVKKFNKICLTEVVNADISIATNGEESYFKTCSDILNMGNMAYKQMHIDHLIHVYIHNYKSFIAVANDDMSDEDFLNLMKANYEQYELISSSSTGQGGISRFVVAFGDDLINKATSAFHLNRFSQNNFIVASNEQELIAKEVEKNSEYFDLINYAINNDTIIPFYQGIYNNEVGKITKYEALMRIADENGRIIPPGVFLEASKQLKLYLSLSKIMLTKALNDFKNIDSNLCLNITLFDIEDTQFREWFLETLKNYPNPERIIIEFVETENYNKNYILVDFLATVREIGCRIAIDDFGVGFASYTSITSLQPDIIKIDGSLIKDLSSNSKNGLIVDSICYMGKLINTEMTAEFVEDEKIQDIISSYGIQYSQGYHFAKPLPFKEIQKDLTELKN